MPVLSAAWKLCMLVDDELRLQTASQDSTLPYKERSVVLIMTKWYIKTTAARGTRRTRLMTNVLKHDCHRRRKQAERARARAKHFFEQLIKITESAFHGVVSLVIQFNNQQGVIDLIDHQDPNELEEERIMKEENEFIHILYNIMYTHYQLQQPVKLYLTILCQTRVEEPLFADDDYIEADDYPGIRSDEDIGSYQLRTHVLPAMRKLFTDDHHDQEVWTYGRRTFRMDGDGDNVSCVINWNHPLPNAGAAAYALGKRRGVPNDLIQYALEWEQRNYAKRFERDPEEWVYDPRYHTITEKLPELYV